MKKGKLYIGTSGYSYDHWTGVFYPADLSKSKWLEFYAKHFQTVELNVTFYRLPQKKAFESWYRRTPKNFLFICKGSRFITHVKKLADVSKPVKLFFDRVRLLKEKLGPILWQFPPSLKMNERKLAAFLKILSKYSPRATFEFRNETWFVNRIFNLLSRYKASLCLADSPYFPCIEEITSDFVYLRFHGGRILYGSNYSKKELRTWAKKIRKWRNRGLDVFAYFNNDAQGFAVKNAKQLADLI